MPTKISWAKETLNPVKGCTKVSEGCTACYAEREAYRRACQYRKNPEKYHYLKGYAEVIDFKTKRWNGKIYCDESALEKPLHWRQPRKIFVCSMSDLFYMPDFKQDYYGFLTKCFAIMALCRQHTFLILTKRLNGVIQRYFNDLYNIKPDTLIADRWDEARKWLRQKLLNMGEPASMGRPEYAGVMMANQRWPLPNVHIGVSVENQKRADERIPILLQIPAAKRFVSFEPLLEEIKLIKPPCKHPGCYSHRTHACEGCGRIGGFPAIDYIIIGAESKGGHPGRECKIEWVRSLVRQAKAAGVGVHIKQLHLWTRKGLKELYETPEEVKINPNRGYHTKRVLVKNIDQFPSDLRLQE